MNQLGVATIHSLCILSHPPIRPGTYLSRDPPLYQGGAVSVMRLICIQAFAEGRSVQPWTLIVVENDRCVPRSVTVASSRVRNEPASS